VRFGAVNAVVTGSSDSTIVTSVPLGVRATPRIFVTTADGTAQSATRFRVTAP
jgi:hypothetical protein